MNKGLDKFINTLIKLDEEMYKEIIRKIENKEKLTNIELEYLYRWKKIIERRKKIEK